MAAKKKAAKKTGKAATKKKTAGKKAVAKKKATAKKALKKPAGKKTAKKKTLKKTASAPLNTSEKNAPLVQPGPPSGSIPPVEEPTAKEEAVGTVTHYYSHLNVAVVQINKGELRTGDRVHIKGHTTDFEQTVESMEYEHQHIDLATAGQSVGLRVKDHVREHDIVYLVK